jgi:hypothetical protein
VGTPAYLYSLHHPNHTIYCLSIVCAASLGLEALPQLVDEGVKLHLALG